MDSRSPQPMAAIAEQRGRAFAGVRRLGAEAGRRFESMLRRVPTGPDGVARVRGRQIYIVPTSTGLTYGAVVLVMLIGSLNYQNNLGLAFTFFLASAGVVAMHHAWLDLLGLGVQIRGGQAVFAGQTASFEVALRAEGRRTRYDIRAGRGALAAHPQHIPARDQRTVEARVDTTARGLCRLGPLKLETQHPMGLFRAWCYIETDASTLVYPSPAARAPEPAHDAGDARRPHRHRGDGAEDYLGSRVYRPGDSPRHVDWKAFARERGLLVKEYGGDQGQDVWIDWSALESRDPEIRLSLMTRQILDASEARVRFGLRLPDGVEPIGGDPAHTQRCLGRLALFRHG